MASGWSPYYHSQRPPQGVRYMDSQNRYTQIHSAPPLSRASSLAGMSPGAGAVPRPRYPAAQTHLQRGGGGGGGLLPHPVFVRADNLLPFPDTIHPAVCLQRVPQLAASVAGGGPATIFPPGLAAPRMPPFHMTTQLPIRLLNTSSTSNTTQTSNGNGFQRRTPRNSDESSGSRASRPERADVGSIYVRPPTPIAEGRSLRRERNFLYQREWSPPHSLYDEDDMSFLHEYHMEFDPYDLSDDSDDDVYFFAERSLRHTSPARLKGGYECQFVTPFSSEVQTECSICLSVLREPFLVDCCGYRFCKTCIETVKADHKPCPLCNDWFKTFPDKQLQRTLNQKKVYCKHKEDGCDWTSELAKLDEHLNIDCDDAEKCLSGCEYTQLKCPHCEKMVNRKDFKVHKIRCSGEEYTCEYCNEYTASFHEVTEYHLSECPSFPVDCPSGCETKIKRSEVPKHIACDCPQTVCPCDYAHLGCKVTLPRIQMTSHLQEGAVDHISLLTSKHQEAQDTIGALMEEFADLAFEVHYLQEINTAILEDSDELMEQLDEKEHMLEEKDREIENLRKRLAVAESSSSHQAAAPSSTSNTIRPQTPPLDDKKGLVVGNLPQNVDQQKIKSLFGQFGRISKVNLLNSSTALVIYEQSVSVDKALARSKAGGIKLHSHRLTLQISNSNQCTRYSSV